MGNAFRLAPGVGLAATGSFAVLRMAVPAPAAWWLRGNARMSDLDCRDSLAQPGDSHRGPFCFCGQQTRLGRRP